MSIKKKTEKNFPTTDEELRETVSALRPTPAADDELREAVREHLLYLAGRGQHTSTTARRLAEVVSK